MNQASRLEHQIAPTSPLLFHATMAPRRVTRSRQKNRQNDPLQRLRDSLQDQNLLDILDSLPPPHTLRLEQCKDEGDHIALCLGDRPKVNGVPCQAWVRIVSVNHMEFYDQEVLPGNTTREYRRSASSLTRKATSLHLPFCFLQHDSLDEARGMPEKLCALILYYAPAAGIDIDDLDWDVYEISLIQALQHIDSQTAYHQWHRDQKPAASGASHISDGLGGPGTQLNNLHDHGATEGVLHAVQKANHPTGGLIQANSLPMIVRPQKSLAKLRDQLGDTKLRLLNDLLVLPMTISPHSLEGNFFPFRMLIGTITDLNAKIYDIFAYLIHDAGKCTGVRYLSHDTAANATFWTVDDLLSATVLEPFRTLNNPGKGSYKGGTGRSARGAKLKSVVSYYFFLAENEGLIDDPLITINDSFGKRLSTAIRELSEASFGQVNDDSVHQEPTNQQQQSGNLPAPKSVHHASEKDNRGSSPTIATAAESEILEKPVEPESLQCRIGETSDVDMPDVEVTQNHRCEASDLDTSPTIEVLEFQRHPSTSPQLAPEAIDSHPATPAREISEHPTLASAIESTGTPYPRKSPDIIPQEDTSETTRLGSPAMSSNDDYVPMDISSSSSIQEHMPPTDTINVQLRASSEAEDALTNSRKANNLVAKVLNNGPPTPEGSVEREIQSQTAMDNRDEPATQNRVVIIDLVSDNGEDLESSSALPETLQRTSRTRIEQHNAMQLSSGPLQALQGSAGSLYWIGSDDDILEEVDGSAHRQAVSRRLQ